MKIEVERLIEVLIYFWRINTPLSSFVVMKSYNSLKKLAA